MSCDTRLGKLLQLAILVGLAAIVAACGAEAPAPESTPAEAPPPPAAADTGPRVFFVEPQEGAQAKSPVHFVFGIEGYELSPVPPPPVETARPAMGHHHLGVDTDCLPVGEVIPQGDPWVHFGKGDTMIDMQLAPGPHKFALQIGDDLHRTQEGLCATLSITVVE